MSATVPVVAVRGSTGISMNYGPPGYDLVVAFTRDDSKCCKTMAFSPDGRYFAWINGYTVKIVSTSTWKLQSEVQRPKVSNIDFSPKGSYFVTWEPFIGNQPNQQGNPNLHIWKSETGELVRAFIHKKQAGWEPQWSADERICARLLNNDVLFYEDSNFEASVHKLNFAKVASFSLSPLISPNYVLCYMPGNPGQPSFGRLFQYPKFDSCSSLANKSFFQADKVDIFWNKRGTEVLLMTSTDVDKTGSSYYGKQTLHFISTKGETAMVLLGKEGPVYSVQWSPKSSEFCVVYGFMPAKATLFNLKCEPIFDFGVGFRNSVEYNPHGNILILGGFGNLRGSIELWDATNRKIISQVDAPDTTLLRWSPDGQHFITATAAPRLREGNGFKIWHYSGSLLYERPWNKQEELWEVAWQTFPPGSFKEPIISTKPVEGIQPSYPQASKQAYRPPSARGKDINFKLHGDDLPTSRQDSMSKNALKLRKKREAKKAKKEQIPDANTAQNPNHTTNHHPAVTATNGLGDSEVTDDPEKLKKIKKIKSKLNEIAKLKEQQAAGRQLELNQVEKIKKEEELTKELNGSQVRFYDCQAEGGKVKVQEPGNVNVDQHFEEEIQFTNAMNEPHKDLIDHRQFTVIFFQVRDNKYFVQLEGALSRNETSVFALKRNYKFKLNHIFCGCEMADNSLNISIPYKFEIKTPPFGMTDYDPKALGPEQQKELNIYKLNVRKENLVYLAEHPEVRALVAMVARMTKIQQPRDVIEFVAKIFTRSEREIRQDVCKILNETIIEYEPIPYSDYEDWDH